jgi:hypothetical protein
MIELAAWMCSICLALIAVGVWAVAYQIECVVEALRKNKATGERLRPSRE